MHPSIAGNFYKNQNRTAMIVAFLPMVLAALAALGFLLYDIKQHHLHSQEVFSLTVEHLRQQSVDQLMADHEGNFENFTLPDTLWWQEICVFDHNNVLRYHFEGLENATTSCLSQLANQTILPRNLFLIGQPLHQNGHIIGTLYAAASLKDPPSYSSNMTLSLSIFILLVGLISYSIIHLMLKQSRLYILGRLREKLIACRNMLKHKASTPPATVCKSNDVDTPDSNQLVCRLSQEVRNPLHAIMSFSSYGMHEIETADRENLHYYFETIHRSSTRLVHQINRMLDLTLINQGKTRYHLEEHSMNNLLDEVITSHSSLLKEKALILRYTPPAHDIMLNCDKEKIAHAMSHILDNAIKFSPAGQAIGVALYEDQLFLQETGTLQPVVIIAIQDEGKGIPDDVKDILFQPFMQSHHSEEEKHTGTGIGLTISQHYIHAHHGKIWIENHENGEGCTFYIVLRKDLPLSPQDN